MRKVLAVPHVELQRRIEARSVRHPLRTPSSAVPSRSSCAPPVRSSQVHQELLAVFGIWRSGSPLPV